MKDSDFFALTPEAILSAADRQGFLTSGHFSVLNSYENRVFDLRLESGEHIIVKFYRPGRWSAEQIQAEHDFLLELAEAEIPVCAPQANESGETLFEMDGIYFAIWPRTGGRIPQEMDSTQLTTVARQLARIHRVGAARKEDRRPVLDADLLGTGPLEFLLAEDWIPAGYASRYEGAAREIIDTYRELAAGQPAQRIHGDCHLGNLLVRDGACFFLDFDDFVTGPLIQDFWMILPAEEARREVFLEEYQRWNPFPHGNPFPHEQWRLVEPLRGLRFIHYSAWIARRWEDPAFPKAFPQFNSAAYWEEMTVDLENQAAKIGGTNSHSSGSNPLYTTSPDEDEPELTNKDFFWDLED